MPNVRLLRFVLPITALCSTLWLTACPDTAAADECCDCLVNTAPDGSDAADGETNCALELEDGNAGLEEELEQCTQQMQVALFAGESADDAFDQGLAADGCRVVCESACSALDPMVSFETPVVSAGTFSVVIDGSTIDATFVQANRAPTTEDDKEQIGIRAETDGGEWNLVLSAISGTGSYPLADFSDFELLSPDMGDAIDGAVEILVLDDHHVEGTFTATLPNGTPTVSEDDVTVSGSFAGDFTVNDDDLTGVAGLQ